MSEPKTCATCRFMAEPRGLEIFGETEAEDTVTEHRSCVRVIHGNGDSRHEAMSKSAREPALVIDGSGYAARLIVLPTFGCVLHEAKPPPP